MPTNHDETLAERYMRELQTELAIYSRMTPEQIGAMVVDLHNALAERDAALAELAALKGGQEAVATVTISHFRQDPTMENVDFQLDAKLPCGTHKLYLAPPAQSNWRDHSVNIAKGEKCPQTIETLQAAWERDQELLLDQRAEIAKLKEKLNQARQKQPEQASAWLEATEAMVLAARGVCVSFRGHYGEHNDYLDDCTARQILRAAMLAAPTPGASDGKGGKP